MVISSTWVDSLSKSNNENEKAIRQVVNCGVVPWGSCINKCSNLMKCYAHILINSARAMFDKVINSVTARQMPSLPNRPKLAWSHIIESLPATFCVKNQTTLLKQATTMFIYILGYTIPAGVDAYTYPNKQWLHRCTRISRTIFLFTLQFYIDTNVLQ